MHQKGVSTYQLPRLNPPISLATLTLLLRLRVPDLSLFGADILMLTSCFYRLDYHEE